MSKVRCVALAVVLSCSAGLAASCDRAGGGSARPGSRLPDPLPLPDAPVALAHAEAPGELLALADPWIDLDFSPRATVERELRRFTTPDLAAKIAPIIDPASTWDAVRLGPEEEIAYVPVLAERRTELTTLLAGLPAQGNFGARVLPRDAKTSSAPRHLAWFDERDGMLAVAQTERGLATAPTLSERYGEAPVVLAVGADLLPSGLPIERAEARGELTEMDVEVYTKPDFDVGEQLESEPGALTGLLSGEELTGGLSSRWKYHDRFVQDVIAQVGDEVSSQPFLVRGLFEDMARRFNALLRSWNGRWAAGVGKRGHVYAAFGSDDPKKSGVAMLRLLQAVVDNVKLARNFTREVPKVSLKKNAGDASGEPIHVFRFARAGTFVPELRPVLDDKGRLNVAFTFSRHAGAGMVVVGPDPMPRARAWLNEAAKAEPGSASVEDLGAATLAIAPAQLQSLRADASPESVLDLQARGPRRSITVRQVGDAHFRLHYEERPLVPAKGAPRKNVKP